MSLNKKITTHVWCILLPSGIIPACMLTWQSSSLGAYWWPPWGAGLVHVWVAVALERKQLETKSKLQNAHNTVAHKINLNNRSPAPRYHSDNWREKTMYLWKPVRCSIAEMKHGDQTRKEIKSKRHYTCTCVECICAKRRYSSLPRRGVMQKCLQ